MTDGAQKQGMCHQDAEIVMTDEMAEIRPFWGICHHVSSSADDSRNGSFLRVSGVFLASVIKRVVKKQRQ